MPAQAGIHGGADSGLDMDPRLRGGDGVGYPDLKVENFTAKDTKSAKEETRRKNLRAPLVSFVIFVVKQ